MTINIQSNRRLLLGDLKKICKKKLAGGLTSGTLPLNPREIRPFIINHSKPCTGRPTEIATMKTLVINSVHEY